MNIENCDLPVLFELSPVGMAKVSIYNKWLSVNVAFCKILGYSKKELLGMTAMEMTHPDDRKKSAKFSRQALDGKLNTYEFETRYKKKDGSYILCMLTASLIRDDNGQPKYFISQILDINDKKNDERELSEKNQIFELMFKNSSIGMCVMSMKGEFLKVNKKILMDLGYKEKELVGKNLSEVIHELDLPKAKAKLKMLQKGKIDTYTEERRYVKKNGDIVWADLAVSVVRDENGEALYYIGQINDITEKKKACRDLEEVNKRYEWVLEATNDGIWDWLDVEGDEAYMSPRWKELLGYKEDEIKETATTFFNMLHPDDRQRASKALQDHIHKNTKYDIEYRFKTKSGEYRWHRAQGIAKKDTFTGKTRMIGTTTDIHDQKVTEYELEKLQGRYDLAVKGSKAGLWYWEFDTNYLFLSPRILEILGANDKTLPPHFSSFEQRLHKDDYDTVIESLDAHIKKGIEYDVEYRLKHDQGHYVFIRARGDSIKDKNGKAYRMGGSIEDITSRKKAEADLKKANERYELVIEASNDGIWEWPDISKDEQYWSPMLIQSLGYKDGELKPSISVFQSIVHPDDTEKVKVQSDLKMLNKPVEVEFRAKCKSGEYKYYLAKSIFKHDKITDTYFVSGTVDDIHNRKMNEIELKSMNERYDMAVRGSRDGIWDWEYSEKEEKLYWSPQMFKIMGYKNLEFTPSFKYFMEELLHPEDHALALSVKAESVNAENKNFDIEYRLKTKSGNYEWFNVKGVMHEYTEELWRSSGILTNIHQRKLHEHKIIEYTKELERINDDLDSFAYIASHDLKEPIRGLNNNAIFLKEDYGDTLEPDAMKRIDRIMFLCARMEKLVDDLLHFARLKNQDLHIKRVDLNKVVEDIQDTIDIVLSEQNAEIVVKRPLPKYVCDRIVVTELFRNLITNGIKYNKSKKKVIEIGYSEEVNKESGLPEYVFYVKDNGIGIAKAHHNDIFKVFKRIHDDDLVRGTGVGLTFVKKIVERHGGKIWLESKLGNGSTFYFTLSSRNLDKKIV